jgi:hypothetical protein
VIPRDEEVDVYVLEDQLVEVWRGDMSSFARVFGADWDGPRYSALEPGVFRRRARVACAEPLPKAWGIGPAPKRAAWRRLGSCWWLVWTACLSAVLGGVLAWGMARGWW